MSQSNAMWITDQHRCRIFSEFIFFSLSCQIFRKSDVSFFSLWQNYKVDPARPSNPPGFNRIKLFFSLGGRRYKISASFSLYQVLSGSSCVIFANEAELSGAPHGGRFTLNKSPGFSCNPNLGRGSLTACDN